MRKNKQMNKTIKAQITKLDSSLYDKCHFEKKKSSVAFHQGPLWCFEAPE